MEFTRIILRPLRTEKTYKLAEFEAKKYAFEVDPKATKHDIAIAFESIYSIRPIKIATQIRKPAKVRTGTAKPGYSKLMKIAYITLPVGQNIVATAEEVKESKPAKPAAKADVTKKDVTKKEVVKDKKVEEAKPVEAKATDSTNKENK